MTILEQDIFVSVIIPMYNSEKTIVKCLTSISNQTYSNIEIICIDDNSEDSTIKYCNLFSNIRLLINEKNEGPLYSRMKGVMTASSDYIIFIDSDDWVPSNYVQKLVETYLDTRADLIISNATEHFETCVRTISITSDLLLTQPDLLNYFLKSAGKDYLWYVFWAKLYHKNDLLRALDKFPANYYSKINEDLLFNLFVFDKIHSIAVCNETTYHYVRSAASITIKELDYNEYLKTIEDLIIIFDRIRQVSKVSKVSNADKYWKKTFRKIWKDKIMGANIPACRKIKLFIKLFIIY